MDRDFHDDFALLCDLRSSRHGPLTPDTIRMIKISVLQDKYKIYRDINGQPRGYVAWADVNVETLLRIQRSGQFPRYFYEWDEGDIRLMLDVLIHARKGDSRTASLISDLVRGCGSVALVRRSRLRIYERKGGRLRLRSA